MHDLRGARRREESLPVETSSEVRQPDPGGHSSRRAAALLVAVGIAALVFGPAVVAVPLVLAVLVTHMPGQSLIRRSAFAVLVLMAVNTAALTAGAVLHLPVSTRWLFGGYLAVGAALTLVRKTPSGDAGQSRERSHAPGSPTGAAATPSRAPDRWALAAAVGVFVALYWPYVGASTAQVAGLLSYSTDGASHLQVARAVLANEGYVHLLSRAVGVEQRLLTYPAGWAGNVAMVIDLVYGRSADHASFLRVAAPLIVGSYALLVYFAVAVALEVARAGTGGLTRAASAAAVAFTVVHAVLGSGVLLLLSSSYTQIPSTTAVLGVVLLVLTTPSGGRTATWLLGALAVVAAHTWYLLAPVFAAVVVVYLALRRPPRWHVLAAAVPTGLLCLYPVLTGPAAATQLGEPGGVPLLTIPGATALLLLTGLVLGLLLRRSPGNGPHRLVLAGPLVACLLLVALVLVIQEGLGSGNNYYAVKLMYTLFFLTAVGAAAVLAHTVQAAQLGYRRGTGIILCALIVSGMVLSSVSLRQYTRPYLSGSAPSGVDEALLSRLLTEYPGPLPPPTDVWVLGCNRRADAKILQWPYDLSLGWDTGRERAHEDFASADVDDLGPLVRRVDSESIERMDVYVSRECAPYDLPQLAARPGVRIIYV